ncbi:MAG: hypothetical protein HQK84_04165 [Nitrospinae bacterium]|nr:hypothetical protein [Nitrospinota bacterium]
MSIFHQLYKTLSLLLTPLFLLLKSTEKNISELKGFLPEVKSTGRTCLWVHALSVGEITAVKPIIHELRKQFDNPVIYLSVSTVAGFNNASKEIFYDYLSYIPLDNPTYIKTALQRVKPEMVIVTETGFWINMLCMLKEAGIPAFLVHGRISEKSLKNYLFFKSFFSEVLNSFKLLITKSEMQRQNFIALGVDEKKVLYCGDSKFDSFAPVEETTKELYRELFQLEGQKVFVAGSTHEGEEEVVLDIFDRILKDRSGRFQDILLIIAPRRIERVAEIEEMCKKKGLSYLLRSNLNTSGSRPQKSPIILLDTVGELKSVYALADLVFIGRSLFPAGGGHSILEPAYEGKFSLFGQYFSYNIEDAERIEALGAAKQVNSAQELESAVIDFFTTPPTGYKENLQKFFHQESGASSRIVFTIKKELS